MCPLFWVGSEGSEVIFKIYSKQIVITYPDITRPVLEKSLATLATRPKQLGVMCTGRVLGPAARLGM